MQEVKMKSKKLNKKLIIVAVFSIVCIVESEILAFTYRGSKLTSSKTIISPSLPCRSHADFYQHSISPLVFISDENIQIPEIGVFEVQQSVYVPSDHIDNFSQNVAGSAACAIVYLWALYEFISRIQTQRACLICNGSGLVKVSRTGIPLTQPRKCYACGGFLPWESWSKFWTANKDIGNGGILRRPARDYKELNEEARNKNNDL